MINVGVIGLGMMGLTHLDVYARLGDVKVVAVSDKDPDRLSGKASAKGNIEGQAQGGIDFASLDKYEDYKKMLRRKDIDVIDVCVPTPFHLDVAKAVLRSGKHLFIEKPVTRTYAQAKKLAAAAEKAKGIAMPAMCMRFWPGWAWLKKVVDANTYGKVRSAHFRRVAQHPGGAFYANGEWSGGAILDLHIHDTDFVQHLFGIPREVRTAGYSAVTGEPDHVFTQYVYDDGPVVVAEGGWAMAPGFGFSMTYTVNFERATATFEFDGQDRVRLCEPGKDPAMVDVGAGMGYEHEIRYFIECVRAGRKPTTVTLHDGATAIAIVEAEKKSMLTGKPARVKV